MRRVFLLASLLLPALLLTGCSNPFTPKNAAYNLTSADTPQGQCERAAYDDPQVKEELAKTAGTVNYAPADAMQELQRVKRNAVQRCMSKRGGTRFGGGVELPRH